jgi:sugar phosphate isomerase/epimerase
MTLSLSGRLIEVEYRHCDMPIHDFLRFARSSGFHAVELRATQILDETTSNEATEIRRQSLELGLGISCVNVPRLPENGEGLRALKRTALLVSAMGCATLKTWSTNAEWIRTACDALEPHGIGIIAQTHTGGPFETASSCLDAVARIDRRSFGLQYDPANLLEAGEDYGENAVERLGGNIRQVSVQNVRPAQAEEPGSWEHQGRRYVRCSLGDPGGLDYDSVFRGLRAIGFDGFVTLNEPRPARDERGGFARQAAEELGRLIQKANTVKIE